MPSEVTILVAEDDRHTAELISLRLRADGFTTRRAASGPDCLAMARGGDVDLIVLDLMLPELDGLDVCHILREEQNSVIPIIMLTARSTEEDTLLGLASGADDYIAKPFSPRELSARISAVLRRTARDDSGTLEWRDLMLEVDDMAVIRGGCRIRLTPTEHGLLSELMRNPGRSLSRQQLLTRAFAHDHDGLERTVDVHITNLRRKIEPDPTQPIYIRTTRGVGYRLGERGDMR